MGSGPCPSSGEKVNKRLVSLWLLLLLCVDRSIVRHKLYCTYSDVFYNILNDYMYISYCYPNNFIRSLSKSNGGNKSSCIIANYANVVSFVVQQNISGSSIFKITNHME